MRTLQRFAACLLALLCCLLPTSAAAQSLDAAQQLIHSKKIAVFIRIHGRANRNRKLPQIREDGMLLIETQRLNKALLKPF